MLLVGGAGRCLACVRALPPQKSTRTNTRTARTARDLIYIMNIYIYIISTTLQFPHKAIYLNQTRTALLAGVLLLRLVGFVGLLLSESRASPVYSSRSKPNSSRIFASGSFESTWGRSAGRWAGGQPVGGALGCTFHLATWLHGTWILPWVPVSSHGRTILYASENACWLERGNRAS